MPEKPEQLLEQLLPPPPEFHSVLRHVLSRSFGKFTIPVPEGGRERGKERGRKGRIENENIEREKDEELKVEEVSIERETTEKDGYLEL